MAMSAGATRAGAPAAASGAGADPRLIAVPVAQSIMADSFPPAKGGQAFALFGVAVVVAPVVGPTLGGWLSDNYSWHWCFLINGPVGLLEIALIAFILREPPTAIEERRRLK